MALLTGSAQLTLSLCWQSACDCEIPTIAYFLYKNYKQYIWCVGPDGKYYELQTDSLPLKWRQCLIPILLIVS